MRYKISSKNKIDYPKLQKLFNSHKNIYKFLKKKNKYVK